MSSVKDDKQSSGDSWSLTDSWDTDSWDDKESIGSITEFLNQLDEDENLIAPTESTQNTSSEILERDEQSTIEIDKSKSPTKEGSFAFVEDWLATTQEKLCFETNDNSLEEVQASHSKPPAKVDQPTKVSVPDPAIECTENEDSLESIPSLTEKSIGKRQRSPDVNSDDACSADSPQKRACSQNKGTPSPVLRNEEEKLEETLAGEGDSQSSFRVWSKSSEQNKALPSDRGSDSSQNYLCASPMACAKTPISRKEFHLYVKVIGSLLKEHSVDTLLQSVSREDWNFENKMESSKPFNLYEKIIEEGKVRSVGLIETRKGNSMKSHFKIQVRTKEFCDYFIKNREQFDVEDEVIPKMIDLLTRFKCSTRTPIKSQNAPIRSAPSKTDHQNSPNKMTFSKQEEANLLVAVMKAIEDGVPDEALQKIFSSDTENTWNKVTVNEKPLPVLIREMEGSHKHRGVNSYRTKCKTWRDNPVKLDSLRIFLAKQGKAYSDELWKRFRDFMENSLKKDSAKKNLRFSCGDMQDSD